MMMSLLGLKKNWRINRISTCRIYRSSKKCSIEWKAQKLGFENVIKKSKMLCYFIFDKNNNFFESLVFKNIMRDIQNLKIVS